MTKLDALFEELDDFQSANVVGGRGWSKKTQQTLNAWSTIANAFEAVYAPTYPRR